MKSAGYSLKNSLKRLGSMEQGEFSHLVKRRLWAKKARLLTSLRLKDGHSSHYRKRDGDRIGSLAVLYDKERSVPFYFDPEDSKKIRKIYKERFGEARDMILRKADEYCNKEFDFLGIRLCFENEINWHYDPMSGREWPKKFIRDIVYTGPERVGDIKIPWELNRQQYLVTLGQAYYLSGDKRYAKEVISSIRSWIRDNPPYVGINWISALEIGIRLISWVWTFHLIKNSDEVTDDFIAEFLTSVENQAEYVSINLSIGLYANNHLIGEAASLAIVGMYFNELKKADRWIKKGLSILEMEALKQIHPDGGGVEQATSYLRFIVEFFLLALLLARKNNIKVRSEAMSRIENAFEFMMFTLKPDGKAPNFGDSDDARAIFLSQGEYWDFRKMLALGAALFNRSDFKWISGSPSEEILWLAGTEGFKTYEDLQAKKPQTKSYLFKDSGYAVMRDSWKPDANYLIFDCGPLGYRSGGHGHADALSFQMVSYGAQALIDPGTFAYNQDQTFRNYFRRTRAHNTMSVDGKDQAEISGRMSWECIPTTVVNDYYFSDEIDMISAENEGYRRLSSPVTHQRMVVLCKDPIYYLIIDKMTSDGAHEYGLHFHFSPGTNLDNLDQVTASLSSHCKLLMDVKCSNALSREIKKGDAAPMGWYSEAYGHKTESPTLSFLCKGDSSIFFYSLLIPYVGKKPAMSLFEGQMKDGATNIVVGNDGFLDTWLINDHIREIGYGKMSFYGELALIRESPKGSLLAAYGVNAIRFRVGEKSYFDSETAMDGFMVKPISGQR